MLRRPVERVELKLEDKKEVWYHRRVKGSALECLWFGM